MMQVYDLFGDVHSIAETSKKRRVVHPQHGTGQRSTRTELEDRTLVWSYGGGTQSIAIAVLVALGKLPKPELIVMADTSREKRETWEYTFRYVLPLLDSVGLTIELASHDLATVDLYGHTGGLLIPAYTEHGKLPTFCSSEWKKAVFRRYVREVKGIEKCLTWIGYSVDELGRAKRSDVVWDKRHFPLIWDVPMNRVECVQLVLNFGWPLPPKSCCIDCPHQRNVQWLRTKTFYPQDFRRAIERDEEARANDTKGGVWLHESRKPLREVDFTQPDQSELFPCDSGYCWT